MHSSSSPTRFCHCLIPHPLPQSLGTLNSNLPTKVFRVPQTGGNRSLGACMPLTTHDVLKNLHCSWLLRLHARCLGLASDEVCLHSTEGFSEKELSLWGQSRGGGYEFPSRSRRGNGFRDGCHTDPFHCPTPPLISTNPRLLAFQSLNFSLPVPLSSFLPLFPLALTHGSNLGALRRTERMCGWAQGRVSTLYISFLSSPV